MRALRLLASASVAVGVAACAGIPDVAGAMASDVGPAGPPADRRAELPARGGLTGRPAMPVAPWVLAGVFSSHDGRPPAEAGIDATTQPATDTDVRRALLGRWQRRASWTDRDGARVQRECVLEVRDASAREECADEYAASPGGQPPCSRSGHARTRVTAASYEWGVSAGDVHFNPGPASVLRDTGCEPEPAESFPVMRARWDGGVDRMELIGTSTASGVGPLVYVRLH